MPGCIGGGAGGEEVGSSLGGAIGGMIIGRLVCPDKCDEKRKPCPPCQLRDGTVVPTGQIAYRYDEPATPQHGISGPHYNLYVANQNPNNCRCFWQYVGTVPPPPEAGWIPIQPFAN